MSYDLNEVSNHDGVPILLYQFTRGSVSFFYCNADRDITIGSEVYKAVAVTHGQASQSGDVQTDTLEITIPVTAEVVGWFRGVAPLDKVGVLVSRYHWNDGVDVRGTWFGRVAAATTRDEAQAVLACQSMISLFGSDGLRLSWQKTCPHMLYDGECRVDKSAFKDEYVITSIGGLAIGTYDAGARGEGWFSGGFIEWESESGIVERRMIEEHRGDTLVLAGTNYGLFVGLSVSAYPGCARTSSVCHEKFNNIDNYGGIIHLPQKSPFTGEVVF